MKRQIRNTGNGVMMSVSRKTAAIWLASLLLCLPGLVLPVDAQTTLGARRAERLQKEKQARGRKIAPDLADQLARTEGKIRPVDLRYPVIIQPGPTQTRADLANRLARAGGRITSDFAAFHLVSAELPLWRVRELAATGLAYVAPDREVRSFAGGPGYVDTQTGQADMARLSAAQKLTLAEGLGQNIAVLDSGVWAEHHGIKDRLHVSLDFTGEGLVKLDPFGHGTHVASLAAGNPHVSKGAYAGIASGAKIISLRVLNSEGTGRVSWVLNALQWVRANAAAAKIRVVNLSLGAPAVESYRDDPMCRAVRGLVDAGLVVVAAAGNEGKDAAGRKQYGAINSPAHEPAALTVGAANDFGTISRVDDGVATYSSRGPTRGFRTDENGEKQYDNLIKPDLVATGNRLLAAESDKNYLLRQYPFLEGGVSSKIPHKYMRLSGSSMATPIVSGAVALILQTNPKLTPNLVKAILMYTAQPLRGYNMFEQGAG
ncbi:MAG: S8 family peptidase, partial [Blastocatellia bacterium]